ncbi:nicotinanamine aminotransferase A [Ectocarpus siliculosus]|uniref:Nicotinanamine aminotransferase A n=1 Tax=Ectocarpus siliculosus TaxID=2880 RepID=D7G750_ECTSI|nr:nicotinanamine aminotransferase A [Ectocarpus siliculosus]|eukprot:CBJ25743.1 nicotinanamine aminotransferase A [Ectocarpus siliculosus]
MAASGGKVLTYDTIAECVKDCQYAVRGEIYLAATERIKAGKEVIFTNVGNPHGLGQKPLTFLRQVMALVMAPFLLEDPRVSDMFPGDAIARAREYLVHVKGGFGAYSDSKGNPYVRQEVCDFIERRDGHRTSPDNIFLTNGASEAVRLVLRTAIRGPSDGVMVPVPQYPLYSASVALYSGTFVGYNLCEAKGWGLDTASLNNALNEARRNGITLRALVFINPGNPTGNCLTVEDLRQLVRFAYDNRLVLMADEVYQENIYQSKTPFTSCKKVLAEMGYPYSSSVELVSFHTVSKGVYGECGLRGGYMELTNIDQRVSDEMYKLCSINLSPNVTGQVAMGIMCNPPKPGSESYALHMREKEVLLQSLIRRARSIVDAFNGLDGVTCEETEGALYAFPKIDLPRAAIDAAKAAGKAPDVFYCLELLKETGLSCVPGSGFGQAEGTYHFRTTILPAEDTFQSVVDGFTSFHRGFMAKYGGGGGGGHSTWRARL